MEILIHILFVVIMGYLFGTILEVLIGLFSKGIIKLKLLTSFFLSLGMLAVIICLEDLGYSFETVWHFLGVLVVAMAYLILTSRKVEKEDDK